MGYTFEVFPSSDAPVPLPLIAERATRHLRRFLEELPVGSMVLLSPRLLGEAHQRIAARAAEVRVELLASQAAALGGAPPTAEPDSVGFETRPGDGGGVIQCVAFGQGITTEAAWRRDLLPRLVALGREPTFEVARRLGWHFEISRTIGQPALATLAHGFIAAAIAELTEGIIYSPDGAWDDADLPCVPETFLARFMRPEPARADRWRRVCDQRLRELPGELTLFDETFVESANREVAESLVTAINAHRGEPELERIAFAEAVARLDTLRLLTGAPAEIERRLLLGDAAPNLGNRSVLTSLHPTPLEYERWLGFLAELLP